MPRKPETSTREHLIAIHGNGILNADLNHTSHSHKMKTDLPELLYCITGACDITEDNNFL